MADGSGRTRRLTISVAERVADAARELSERRHLPLSRVIADAVMADRKRLLEQDMAEGYRATTEENYRMAEEAVAVDNETWPPE